MMTLLINCFLAEAHVAIGPIVQIAPRYFSISDPDALKVIYGHGTKFEKAPWYQSWKIDKTETNLFIEKSAAIHSVLRRKVASMYSMSSLMSYEPFVVNCISLFQDRLREKVASGEQIDLAVWLQYYAFDVIGEITVSIAYCHTRVGTPETNLSQYGKRFGFLAQGADIDGMMASVDQGLAFFTYLGLFLWLQPLALFLFNLASSSQTFLVKFMLSNIAIAKQTSDFTDEDKSTSMTMKLVKAQQKDPDNMSDAELLTFTASNIGAGSDTTAIGLSSVVYYLYKSSKALKKLRDELDAADLGDYPSFKDAQKLPYLQAVINEGLRMHPGVGLPLFRTVPAGGAEVAGTFFPPGVSFSKNER